MLPWNGLDSILVQNIFLQCLDGLPTHDVVEEDVCSQTYNPKVLTLQLHLTLLHSKVTEVHISRSPVHRLCLVVSSRRRLHRSRRLRV